jgi:hypothetical protein
MGTLGGAFLVRDSLEKTHRLSGQRLAKLTFQIQAL